MKKNIIIILAVFAVLKNVLGYPQERLMPDGAPVITDESSNEDSVAAASETHNHEHDYDESDDSDMYMEPDGAESVHQEPKEIIPSEIDPHVTARVPIEAQKSVVIAEEDKVNPVTDSQNFFPSFADIFTNHKLPPYNDQQQQQQQQRYRPNRFLGYFQRERSAYQPVASSSTVKNTQHPLLGSGNFGVIRGGTYYPEEKENDEYSVVETLYNPYYNNGNNARGRSNYYKNPKPQPIRGGDFFANFRDFADITAPPKSSFSHLSVVYANRNGTQRHANEPRNIIETLKMLEDQENENINGVTTIKTTTKTSDVPTKKVSQAKRKLQNMKKYHEEKARKYRMTIEPLLALS